VPVYFCIVATDEHVANQIFNVAAAAAALDPIGRKVIRIGQPPCPSDADIATACANVDPRGAIVLRNDFTVFDVLNVEDALNGAIVDDDFAQAAGGQ
jgi:hypothetical protein